MSFFKPEDFMGMGDLSIAIANCANDKLEREGKVVHGKEFGHGFVWDVNLGAFLYHTHKALLINIEPIEKCKHQKEKIHQMNWSEPAGGFNHGINVMTQVVFKCTKCGAKVQPKEFEEVK